jgi:hypothetical protein
MSADNGIYIHHFKDGWRVVHGQAVENAFEGGTSMDDYFSDGKVFKTEDEAWKYARKLYKKIMGGFGIIEYGISEI